MTSRSLRWTIGFASGLVLLAACRQKQTFVAYEPVVEIGDLAADLAVPASGYALTAPEGSVGRFPCSLAIARLAPRDETRGAPAAETEPVPPADPAALRAGTWPPDLTLRPLRPMDEAAWTERLRGLRALRDVIFLSPRSTKLEGQTPAALCAAAHRLGANLLVVYAASGLGANSAQSVGVLYDTPSATPLATIYASARILDAEGVESSPNPRPGDHRRDDARYQAQRQFEGYVEAALRELMARDRPPPSTQPSRWQTPPHERWWLPPFYPRW